MYDRDPIVTAKTPKFLKKQMLIGVGMAVLGYFIGYSQITGWGADIWSLQRDPNLSGLGFAGGLGLAMIVLGVSLFFAAQIRNWWLTG